MQRLPNLPVTSELFRDPDFRLNPSRSKSFASHLHADPSRFQSARSSPAHRPAEHHRKPTRTAVTGTRTSTHDPRLFGWRGPDAEGTRVDESPIRRAKPDERAVSLQLRVGF